MPDPEKVKCESCGVTILATTAESYDDYCAPCYKKFNERSPVSRQLPQRSFFAKVFDFVIPIGFIALFFIGIPFGYKLVLGGRTSSIKSGTTERVKLIHEIPGKEIDGRPARIVQDYLIIELKSGRSLWIPEENVAGIEFAND